MRPRWWTTLLLLAVLATLYALDIGMDLPGTGSPGLAAELRTLATGGGR